jgi:hypothetical protein
LVAVNPFNFNTPLLNDIVFVTSVQLLKASATFVDE